MCKFRGERVLDNRPQVQKGRIEVYENLNKKFQLGNKAEDEGAVSSKVLTEFTVSLIDIFLDITMQISSQCRLI